MPAYVRKKMITRRPALDISYVVNYPSLDASSSSVVMGLGRGVVLLRSGSLLSAFRMSNASSSPL